MILRLVTDLLVPFSNNIAERDQRLVKVQQRTSGGCRRTLRGLADFAVVQSYLSTAGKWGRDKLDALVELNSSPPARGSPCPHTGSRHRSGPTDVSRRHPS